jgi:hypothetical protein
MTPIKLRFTLGVKEYLAAQYFHAESSVWLYANLFAARFVLPVIGVLLIVQSVSLWRHGNQSVLPFFLAPLGVFFVLYPLYYRFNLRHCYTRSRTGNDECELLFDEDTIRVQGPNSSGEMKWAAFKKFSENDKLYLLYLAPAKFIIVPKHYFETGQVDEFRALLARKLQ